MRCRNPRTVGFKADGKTISWSQKQYSREFATFQLPCGKCIECRLEYARSWAIRCMHEAKMHEDNSFITLTYSEEHLKSPKLITKHFDDFVKRLRSHIFEEELKRIFPHAKTQMDRRLAAKALTKESRRELHNRISISVFGVGEYGDKGGRPHWHACIFNWRPKDAKHKYTTERGDEVFSSTTLGPRDETEINGSSKFLWQYGIAEFGSVTFESAGYCARYAAKKLVHGHDQNHDLHPVPKKSGKNAIGKTFLAKYWKDIFTLGRIIILKDDKSTQQAPIPRYYEKWLQKNEPEAWKLYVTQTKPKITKEATDRHEKDLHNERRVNEERSNRLLHRTTPVVTKTQARAQILDQKFKELQKRLKL